MDAIVNDKRRILLTGSSGYIGRAVLAALSRDYLVIGLDIVDRDDRPPSSDWRECDLTDDESVADALTSIRETYGDRLASVIHLAAYYDFSGEPSLLYDDLTVEGTRRLLRQLQSFQVEQFVFSSSLLVMEPTEPDETLNESSRVHAEWEYPQSKLDTERVISLERGRVPVVILRIAGVYDDHCHSIPISQQIRRIYEKDFESHLYPGDPGHGQSFVHLEDLVDCFVKTVEMRPQLGLYEMFLIGEPRVVSYGDLQDQIGQLIHDRDWPTIRVPKAIAKVGAWAMDEISGGDESFIKPWMIDLADAHYPVDISHAREQLGWYPAHCLRDALPRMVGFLLQKPEEFYRENQLTWPEDE